MRVTNNQILLTVLQNVRRPAQRMMEGQTKLSSGKRINHHYDDPLGSGVVQQLRGDKASAMQYQRNINDGLIWMQQTEGALDRLEKNLMRSKSLAVKAANSSNSPSDRKIIAKEINQVLEDVLSIANTNFRSKYVFAGNNTTSRPFVEIRDSDGKISSIALSDAVTGKIERTIAKGLNIQMNIPGSDVFNLSDGPFATLINLRDSLETNDIDGINKSLDALDKVLESSLNARTIIGSRMNRMEAANRLQQTSEIDITATISSIEDADIAELVMRLNSDEVSYRAALGASARLMQTSLVDLMT